MIKVTSPVYWHHDFLTWWTEKGISLSKSQEDPPRAFLMPFSKTELKSNTEETQILAADKAQNVSTDTRASLPVSVQRCQLILSSWRRKWQPTPVLLPGNFHGWRSLVGYSPWGCKESDTTERLHFLSIIPFGEENGNPVQCSCLENPMDRGAWWAAVYGVAKSRTWLSN